MKDLCIIIQGPSRYVDTLREKWGGDFPIIWSTWKGEEDKYKKGDIVVVSEKPKQKGVQNLYLQQVSSLVGINVAEKFGFKNVIKWRSDQYPTNPKEFVNLFSEDKLTFLSAHTNSGNPYVLDYFMGGSIEDMKKLWSFGGGNYLFPEQAITLHLKNTNLINKTEFLQDKLTNENDVFWLGREFGCLKMLTESSHVYNPKVFENL